MKERVQADIQHMEAKLEAIESNSQLHLEQELAGWGKQLSDYQTESHSASARLTLRIQDLEAQNTKVTALVELYT